MGVSGIEDVGAEASSEVFRKRRKQTNCRRDTVGDKCCDLNATIAMEQQTVTDNRLSQRSGRGGGWATKRFWQLVGAGGGGGGGCGCGRG